MIVVRMKIDSAFQAHGKDSINDTYLLCPAGVGLHLNVDTSTATCEIENLFPLNLFFHLDS